MNLTAPMKLADYEIVIVNTSAGKDSEVSLDLVHKQAVDEGVVDSLHVVHCDLGRVEWAGTRELAERQTSRYGLPFHVVSRPEGDLLEHVEQKGKWPGFQTRFCTSDHKTSQVLKLITRLVTAYSIERWGRPTPPKGHGPVKVLNVLGIRADESEKRRKMGDFVPGLKADGTYRKGSSSVRQIDNWHPVHQWTEQQIWDYIREHCLEYHKAYDLGMPRLSCVFCIYAPEEALLLAGYHNRELLAEYVRVENAIDFSFRHQEPLVQIQEQLAAGYVPHGPVSSDAWMERCAA